MHVELLPLLYFSMSLRGSVMYARDLARHSYVVAITDSELRAVLDCARYYISACHCGVLACMHGTLRRIHTLSRSWTASYLLETKKEREHKLDKYRSISTAYSKILWQVSILRRLTAIREEMKPHHPPSITIITQRATAVFIHETLLLL